MFENLKQALGIGRPDMMPCPGCGSGRTVITGATSPMRIFVRCQECRMEGPSARGRTEAVLAWNAMAREDEG